MVNQWNFGTPASGTSKFYNVWNDQYRIVNNGFLVYISFNANDKIIIPQTSNFNNTVNEVEFVAESSKFSGNNYINVKYTVTNKASTQRAISIGIQTDINVNNNDSPTQKNLEGFKGVQFIDPKTNKDAVFLLRDSYGVTDVDTYFYKHSSSVSSDYYVFKNATSWTDVTGVNTWLCFSWRDRVFEPGETKVFTHSIGTGDYNIGYTYTLEENFSEFYLPTETISTNLKINSISFGDTLTVQRCIDEEECKQIYTAPDEGNNFRIPDSFKIPKIGYHTVRYITKNNKSIEYTQNHTFTVNIPPSITINDRLKSKYYPQEVVNLSIDVFDDFYTDVLVVDETLALSQQFSVICNGAINQTYITFQIPQYALGSQHKISILASDLYLQKSEIINHTFTIGGIPPDFLFKSKVPMLSYPTTNKFIAIEGLLRNKVGSDKLICYSSINENTFENEAFYLPDNEWHNFTILRSLSKISLDANKPNNVSLYFENSQSDQSEVTTFYFEAIFYLQCKCTFNCNSLASNYAYLFTLLLAS